MPSKTGMCENIASLVCDTSLLKSTDYRIKGKTFGFKICDRCELGIVENVIVLQCPYYYQERTEMFNELEMMCDVWVNRISTKDMICLTFS